MSTDRKLTKAEVRLLNAFHKDYGKQMLRAEKLNEAGQHRLATKIANDLTREGQNLLSLIKKNGRKRRSRKTSQST